jgi:hypothetical protein
MEAQMTLSLLQFAEYVPDDFTITSIFTSHRLTHAL